MLEKRQRADRREGTGNRRVFGHTWENTKKQVTSVILMAPLLLGCLGGCGTGDQNHATLGTEDNVQNIALNEGDAASGAKGRFLESEVAFPENVNRIMAMGKMEDGRIEVMAQNTGMGTGYLLQSEDMGESWTSVEVQLGDCYLDSAAIAPDGEVTLVGYFEEVNNAKEQLVRKIATDGTITEIPCSLPEVDLEFADTNWIMQAGYDASGRLFAESISHQIWQIAPETGEAEEVCEDMDGFASYFGIAGEKLLLVSENGIAVYNTADGSRLPEDEVLNGIIKSDSALSSSSSDLSFPLIFAEGMDPGSVVYADSNGVFYHRDGGSIAEQLVGGELSSLGSTRDFCSMAMMDEEHLLLYVLDASGNGKLLKYTYDKDVPATPEKELKIYALEDSSILRQAITMYQKQNQNVYVSLEIGMSGEDGVSAEDAISSLNTEIMAGNAPDVMILDGLPVDSYIEKGILADIGGVINQIADTDGILENIRDVYEKDGVCYAMPVRIYLMVVDGPAEAVAAGRSLDTFADYAEKLRAENPEGGILPERSAKEQLWHLYQADSAGWLREDGALDEEKLKNWLKQAKRLYDLDSWRDDAPATHISVYDNSLFGTIVTASSGIVMNNNLLGYGCLTGMFALADMLASEELSGCSYEIFGDQKSFVPFCWRE